MIQITAFEVDRYSQHPCHAGPLCTYVIRHNSIPRRCASLLIPWPERSIAVSRDLRFYKILLETSRERTLGSSVQQHSGCVCKLLFSSDG